VAAGLRACGLDLSAKPKVDPLSNEEGIAPGTRMNRGLAVRVELEMELRGRPSPYRFVVRAAIGNRRR